MDVFFNMLLGAAVAAFGTLIGAGGGIIFIPLFMFLFDWPPAMIIGTSLTIVLCNAVSGSYAYMRQGKIKYDAAWLFSMATVPGAITGAFLSSYFTGPTFRLAFGCLLTVISLLLLVRNLVGKIPRQAPIEKDFAYSKTAGVLVSIAVGFISSIFGIGGGVIHVPAMIYLLGFPTHIATATSHFVLAISAAVGVVTHQMEGHILWGPALQFGIGAIIGAQFGAHIAKRVQAKSILILLALALLALGIRLIVIG